MTLSLLGRRGLGDFRHFWRLGSLCGHTPRPQAVLDIFFCHDLYFLTMVGRENRSENAPSASAAENQFLIFLILILSSYIIYTLSLLIIITQKMLKPVATIKSKFPLAIKFHRNKPIVSNQQNQFLFQFLYILK